jgi:ATP-dependent DNA helicase PIF1
MLSTKQQLAFDAYKNGENVFISGPGGTGKSYFIKKVYEDARQNDITLQVTSLTGCSAANLDCGAMTIHKWCGFVVTDEIDTTQIIRNIKKYGHAKKYINTSCLIIDEISMMDQKFFEILDYVCKRIKKCDEAFGGIQLICCADFFQLPPICKDKDTKFCFESPLWNHSFSKYVLFDENFRQKGDTEYYDILQNIRKGNVTHEDFEKLIACTNKSMDDMIVKPTILFPTKKQADEVNMKRLNDLDSSQPYTFSFKYQHSVFSHTYKNKESMQNIAVNEWMDFDSDHKFTKEEERNLNKQLSSMMFSPEQTFKVGAQVMCIANLDQEIGIVNGAQGIITRFEYDDKDKRHYPYVKFDNYAFEKKIKRHVWKNDIDEKLGISQIPLILSWAITIHKSQGVTLDKAYIDVGNRIFESGQTYVALSRVKSLEGLYLKSFNPQRIRANPKVVRFYDNNMLNSCATTEAEFVNSESKILAQPKSNKPITKQKQNKQNTPNKKGNIQSFFVKKA